MTDTATTVDVDAQLTEFARTRCPQLRSELVDRYYWIVHYVARRYEGRGEPRDDIVQVAALGLVAALDRFDPSEQSSFPGFAIPTALGEVRRHFRDRTWRVRVPRRVKDLSVQIGAATDELTADLGRSPSAEEIADRLGTSVADVLEARSASAANHPVSVEPGYEGSASSQPVRDIQEHPDHDDLVGIDERLVLHEVLGQLPDRSRRIIELAFFEGLSQDEVARRIGISQPHVSRLMRASLRWMREHLREAS